MLKNALSLILLLSSQFVSAQTPPPAALAQIKETEIRKDVYDMCDPYYRGRSAGTVDELNGAVWLEEKFRAMGIKPLGDKGSYFQFFSLCRFPGISIRPPLW